MEGTAIKLKVCPWCGRPPKAVPWHGGGPYTVHIMCRSDDCEVQPSVCKDSPTEATEAWNNRSPHSTLKREVVISNTF